MKRFEGGGGFEERVCACVIKRRFLCIYIYIYIYESLTSLCMVDKGALKKDEASV